RCEVLRHVDEDRQAAAPLHRGVNGTSDRVVFGDVGLHKLCIPACRFNLRDTILGLLDVDVRDGDDCAFRREALGDGAPETLSTARDECATTAETFHPLTSQRQLSKECSI